MSIQSGWVFHSRYIYKVVLLISLSKWLLLNVFIKHVSGNERLTLDFNSYKEWYVEVRDIKVGSYKKKNQVNSHFSKWTEREER